MFHLVSSPALFAASALTPVHVTLTGASVSDRKMSALNQADACAVVAISHGSGKVAKQAAQIKANDEFSGVADNIANGNLKAFAVKVAATLGETVQFGSKDEDGNVIRKASDDFREFGATLRHKMLQLQDKGKVYSASGKMTAAAADLAYLISLHANVVRKMDERMAADAERRERLAMERAAEVQAEKGADEEVTA